ncbi:AAA family ATPase [Sporomusa termitida]|uniref:Restriction system-associated AAA family ATPase n=1 Tax=Sporomusa termitida TaxID=2377 RepID=A0A517DVD0_9FIRM|nr:AAA family ATPase [Sporomusa termitida]QDR81320.1 restriction system-associated AAA family ATPase [Sporomusa termitida]
MIIPSIRQNIIDILTKQSVPFYGESELIDFLTRIWDLKTMPSTDPRFRNAEEDIVQHMISNYDWSEKELLWNYLKLSDCDDQIFIDFLELTIHPDVQLNIDTLNERLYCYSEYLEYSGYTVDMAGFIVGTPVYRIIKIEEVSDTVGIPFYTVEWKGKLPQEARFPCIQLMGDSWNDYGYQTLFHASYFISRSKKYTLGDVKILEKGRDTTDLPDHFYRLNPSYCSLGQSVDYYKEISAICLDLRFQVLDALNDIAINEALASEFKSEEAFSQSLLRYSEAEKAFKEGKNYINIQGNEIDKNFDFTFSYKLSKAEELHIIKFNFNENDYLPYRINLLIGKNGTGKTQLLASLAQIISGNVQHKDNFFPDRPSFSKIIAISYSIFDEFSKPEKKHQNYGSYKYCGVRNRQGYLDLQAVVTELNKAKATIIRHKRVNFWKDILCDIMEDEELFSLESNLTVSDLAKYSSGQNMVFATMTQVIAYIEKDSLLLFDEPETHLHPNAIAKVVRALYKLLNTFESYAIIASHSPVIAQEVPSKYIHIIERIGNVPSVRVPGIECFGENLTTITNDIFYVGAVPSIHKDYFIQLAKQLSYEDILSLFEKRLSFNAKMIVKALISEDNNNEKSKPAGR